MLSKLRAATKEESGFTLVELLVVIAILGILASVVVFSVAGITDDGTQSACKAEAATVRAAQEAHYAKSSPKVYAADAAALETAGLLGGTPTYVTTSSTTPFKTYSMSWAAGATCTGTP
jgi:general secretion pathway protein G